MKLIQTMGNYALAVVSSAKHTAQFCATVILCGFLALTGMNVSQQMASVKNAPAVAAVASINSPAKQVASVDLTAAGIEAAKQVLDSKVMRVLSQVVTVPSASAQYSIVSSDASGNITFSPSALVTPVITGVIACVISAAALVLLWIGVRWLYKVLHGSK